MDIKVIKDRVAAVLDKEKEKELSIANYVLFRDKLFSKDIDVKADESTKNCISTIVYFVVNKNLSFSIGNNIESFITDIISVILYHQIENSIVLQSTIYNILLKYYDCGLCTVDDKLSSDYISVIKSLSEEIVNKIVQYF